MLRNFLFVCAIVLSFGGWAQDAEKAAIERAIARGDAGTLSSYFVPTIDLMVGDLEDVYSRDQAHQIMSRFFSEHKPVEFLIRHEGKSKSNDFYYIGDLKTDNGVYRITFFLKKGEPAFQIKQLRVEGN
jgi:hypothetical protein